MMGLSSKQVAGDHGVDWGRTLFQAGTPELAKHSPTKRQLQQQQQQQKTEPLKCPRCDSTNTKFCYYNNYNRSQPRHFCKSCKRHWTKGGTLRNVPIGGGRKNRGLKTPAAANKANSATSASGGDTDKNYGTKTHMGIRAQERGQNLPIAVEDHKSNISQALHQLPIPPNDLIGRNSYLNCKSLSANGDYIFQGSSISLHQFQNQNQNLHIPFPSLSSFAGDPRSISSSFHSSNIYDHCTKEHQSMEDPTVTGMMLPTMSSTINTEPWQVPTSSSAMDLSYWNLDDIDEFGSSDFNPPWGDSDQIKH